MIFTPEEREQIYKIYLSKIHIPENGNDPSACWTWTGARLKAGYGKLSFKSKKYLAHRLTWIFKYGSIPADRSVCHFCDNPPCVRLEHIWMGTNAQNMYDAKMKGILCQKLSLIQRSEIIKRFFFDKESVTKIAADYNVKATSIFRVVYKDRNVVKKYGRRPPIRVKIPTTEYEKIHARYKSGETMESIAKDYYVYHTGISKILMMPDVIKKFGKISANRLTKKDVQDIYQLYLQGWIQKDIARKYGKRLSSIWSIIKRLSLEQSRTITKDTENNKILPANQV